MILDIIANADCYTPLHPLFFDAFKFMRTADLFALAPGRHAILDERIFAISERAAGRSRADAKLECHRRYIDIQLVLSGTDEMGWKALADCKKPMSDYSMERDIRFFNDTPAIWVKIPPGAFCIFFPEDAHAPLVGSGNIHKVIFKIAVLP
jgi:biofilm protein TabA